ncbi:MAG: TRC40/GET3/ArsA family transport-energizing ATPase [Pseudomonadota bacterium]
MPLPPLSLLAQPTRHLFFAGKGGVGKSSLAAACAIALADSGRRVLLVSTDAVSNLDEMLGVPLRNAPVPVPGVPAERGQGGLWVLNIDPVAAAEAYRERALAQLSSTAGEEERRLLREQLAGACATEMAVLDEWVSLLAGAERYEHLVFDTAPSGHTLRMLGLPRAWSAFLAGNEQGAVCLGPRSGLKAQQRRLLGAMRTLVDRASTSVVLVARPDATALAEAGRVADELRALGLTNQRLLVNATFRAGASDLLASALQAQCRAALADLPLSLCALPRDNVPLRPFDSVGLASLRELLGADGSPAAVPPPVTAPAPLDTVPEDQRLDSLIDQLAAAGRGLVLLVGKGGAGKTTLAAALALGLVRRGHGVHLSTTDPAAHLGAILGDGAALPGLRLSRVDPQVEVRRHVDAVVTARGEGLDEAGRARLLAELRSPCTEAGAVFEAFAQLVNEAHVGFVVLDTAATGQTLQLLASVEASHRQRARGPAGDDADSGFTPLMRLREAAFTRVIVVTLPEPTPVLQAQALQDDLRRAGIEPYAWVVNRSLAATDTREPLLRARLRGERRQMTRITGGLAQRLFVLPWQAPAPMGAAALQALATPLAARSPPLPT